MCLLPFPPIFRFIPREHLSIEFLTKKYILLKTETLLTDSFKSYIGFFLVFYKLF